MTGTAARRVIFRNNSTASCGGALCLHGGNAANTSVIQYADIVNNTSRNFGGGIDIDQARYVTLENCLIQGNTSSIDGGGIAMEDNVIDLVIKDSIIDRNSAGGLPHSAKYRDTKGGGGGISFDNKGTITISNSSITNNSAPVNGGGSPIPASQTVDYGQGVYRPTPDPTKPFSTFQGWVTANGDTWDFATAGNPNSGAPVRSDMTLYAKWRSDEFKIAYDLDNGTNDANNPSTYTYGVGVQSFADPVRDHYQFLGWFDAATGGNQITSISDTDNGDKTLYARWKAIDYDITYELDGGTNDSKNPAKYTYGVGVPSFESATKDGYIFLGWFDKDGSPVSEISETATGTQTLYAHWKQDYARIEVKPIERTILKNTTYAWQHTHHEPVFYDEDNNIVPDAELWATVNGMAYNATDIAQLPEGVYEVTFTNVNPLLRFNPFSRLVTRAAVKEVTAQTTVTILAKDATDPVKKPAPITVNYVDQSGKVL